MPYMRRQFNTFYIPVLSLYNKVFVKTVNIKTDIRTVFEGKKTQITFSLNQMEKKLTFFVAIYRKLMKVKY